MKGGLFYKLPVHPPVGAKLVKDIRLKLPSFPNNGQAEVIGSCVGLVATNALLCTLLPDRRLLGSDQVLLEPHYCRKIPISPPIPDLLRTRGGRKLAINSPSKPSCLGAFSSAEKCGKARWETGFRVLTSRLTRQRSIVLGMMPSSGGKTRSGGNVVE